MLALLVVAAVDAVTAVAVAPGRKALAVQLEAARILAVAVLLRRQRRHRGARHLRARPRCVLPVRRRDHRSIPHSFPTYLLISPFFALELHLQDAVLTAVTVQYA